MKSIYRIGTGIYDAQTNQRIANPTVLARDYAGATEVGAPSQGVDNATANSTPAIVRPGQYGMSDWRSYQALKDATAEVIKIRQAGNKDIIDPTTYWKGQMRNSADISDPRLKELSPADQASLRLSRQGTASAALNSLDQERQYREGIAGDTMTNLNEMYGNQVTEKNNEAEAKYKADSLAADTKYKNEMLAIERYNAGMGGGNDTPSRNGVITDPTGNSYDISSYASDASHEDNVRKIISGMGQLKSVSDMDNYMNSKVSTTPITGQMVADAAKKYGVSWEAMIAIMQQDSSLGTKGLGARTNNPGNVGTYGSNVGSYPTMESGVEAVAKWLSEHKSGKSYDEVNQSMPTGKKNNNLTQAQMRALAVDTGIDFALIPQMTQQEVVNAQAKASVKTVSAPEDLADTLEGKKIGVTYGLSRDDLVSLFTLISGGLTTDEQNKLLALGIKQEAIDAAISMASPTTSSSGGTRAGIKQ